MCVFLEKVDPRSLLFSIGGGFCEKHRYHFLRNRQLMQPATADSSCSWAAWQLAQLRQLGASGS